MRFLVLSALFFFAAVSQAQLSIQNDFDGDGLSDLTLISIQSDGSLSWQALYSSGNTLTSLGNLGQNGDHIVLARWTSPSSPQIGVISVAGNGEDVIWSILSSGSQTREVTLGKKSGIFVSGADFDNSGLADAAVASKAPGGLSWEVVMDPFKTNSTAGESVKFKFGSAKRQFFFFNPFGQGDWLAFFRPLANGRESMLHMRNPVTKQVMRVRTKRINENSLRPQPVAQSTGVDLIAIATRRKTSTLLKFMDAEGRGVGQRKFVETGNIVVGNLRSAAGEEIAVQGQFNFVVFNPAVGELSNLALQTGIPVDEINVNQFEGSVTPNPTPPPSGVCTAQDPSDGADGFVWKPNSDTQHYAVTVMPPALTGKISEVQVLSSTKQYIKSLTYKGIGNGNRTSWQDYALTGADYKRTYGSIILKVILDNGGCLTYPISDPSQRVD